MKSKLSFKRLVCVSLSLSQILSTSVTSLVAADLRVRDNHIVPLANDPLAPEIKTSANGREAVNILNPDSKGISHNKYERFDIAKDNGVILNNSMQNGVSLTGGVVSANPNLSSEAKLIINEIVSKQHTSLEGTLEVFGKNADVIIANENGIIVNGATFINTSGVTLTTGLIDRFNNQINVRGGNISILERGVGLDGDYFSVISQSMQLAGNIAKLDGKPLDRMNYIAGLNNIKLNSAMKDPQIISTSQSEKNKPKLAIDGDMLGSMYAGYIKFLSTQQGVGVQHKGVIKSADDIVIDSNGDILTSALIAQNITLKTSSDVINNGVIIGNKNLDIDAKALTNQKDINTEAILKAKLDLNESHIQAENVNLNLEKLDNQAKIVGMKALNIKSLGASSSFENNGDMVSQNIKIQANTFKNNASITSNTLDIQASDLINTSDFNADDANLDISLLKNTGKIASKNNLIINFKDNDKSLNQVLQNEKGTLSSKNILNIQSGTINLDKTLGNIIAEGKLAFNANKDIIIQKDFINKGSLELKALGNITNNTSVLLASGKDLYLSAKAFLNNANAYVFGDNIKIEADDITNNQNAVIDARNTLYFKSNTLTNNAATLNSGSDLIIITNTLHNNGITNGDIKFKEEPNLRLSYYFAKDYFGNRNFSATAKTYSIQNNLENKQAIIKSGGNLYIQSDGGKNTDVYNSNSLIAAKKDIEILGNIYNTTMQKGYDVGSLLENFYISNITAVATYLGGGTYKIGKGGAITVLNKAFYANDDNQGYFGLLKDLAAKNNLFKSLMARAFGVDWIMAQNPWQLKKNYTYNPNALISFTPKNPAQIIAGNNIVIKGGAIYNSTGSESKIKTDIDKIKTNLKNIQINENLVASTSKNPPISDSTSVNKKPKNIFESTRLSEKQIMDLGKSVLFQTKEFNPNVAINYYIETRPDLVDMNKFYGSQYLFSKIGYEPQKPVENKASDKQISDKSQKYVNNKPLIEQPTDKSQKYVENKVSDKQISDKSQKSILVIGDAYYENKLLNEQLTRNLGYTNTLSPDDVKNLLDNAAVMTKKLGLVVGKALSQEQIEQLDDDIVWYVSEKIGGREVLVPQLYYSKNTSLNKTDEAKNSTIASSKNMFLQTGTLKNDDGSFIAAGSLNIKSVGNTENIGGVIAAQNIAIDANKLISQSKIDIDEKGNLTTVQQATISANKDINIWAQDDITIKNALVSSQSNGGKVNLVAKNGSIQIIDDEAHTSNYVQTTLEKDDYFEVKTSMQKQTFSSGSLISGSTINIQSSKDFTIKGSSLSQTSKEGSINLSALGDVNIVSGNAQTYLESTRYFSGVNEQTGMREYATYAQATQNHKEALASSIKASGNVNIISQNNLNIESSEINSKGKVILNALRKVTIKDAQNVSTLNTSDTSYQVLGVKGGYQTAENSTSSGSKIKADGGFAVVSKGDINIIGSDLEAKDILLSAEGKFVTEAGKSTSKQESTSFAFGVVGQGKAGIASSEVSASFGIDDNKNFTSAQSAFQPQSLTSGKPQLDSLATSELGLEFSWQNSTQSSTTYKNANLKTSNGDLIISANQSADIGGSNMGSANNIVLRAEEILSSKYTDEVSSHNFGFSIALTQKVSAVSAVADAANMISNMAVSANNKENLNGAFVAAQAVGAATNLIFGDLIGGVSTQEASFQVYNQDSHKTSQNINQITAAKGIQFESTKGNIELSGAKMKADSLNLNSAKDIIISNALETVEENGFSVGLQARLQETVGYSALWGANGDGGVGGGFNFAYNQNSEQKSKASEFEIKNQANLKAQNDLALIGSKITAGSFNADIGGDLRIISAVDTKNSQNANANLGADSSLGGASNTIAKGDVSMNAGAGYYHDNSRSVGMQAGIVTQGELNINAKGNALLEGAILSSATKQGGLSIGGELTINDLDLYKDKAGGSASLSGGMSGNFGGHVNLGDNESQTSRLYSAVDISVNAKNVAINGTKSSVKDIYTDTQNSNVILSGSSFVGGNMSFSGNTKVIKGLFGNKPESSQPEYQEHPSDDSVVLLSFNQISDLPEGSRNVAGSSENHNDPFVVTGTNGFKASAEQIASLLDMYPLSDNANANHTNETSQNSKIPLSSKIKSFFSTENYYDVTDHTNETSQESKKSLFSTFKDFFSKKDGNKNSYDVTDPATPKEESFSNELPTADHNDPFVVTGTNGFKASAEKIASLLDMYPLSDNANANHTSESVESSIAGSVSLSDTHSSENRSDPFVITGNNGFRASTAHIASLLDNNPLPFKDLFHRNPSSDNANHTSESVESSIAGSVSLSDTHSPSESILLNPYNPSSYVEASFAPSNDTPPSLLSRFKNLFSTKPAAPNDSILVVPYDPISYAEVSSAPLNETHSPSESILLNPYNPSSYVEASFAPSNDTPPSLLSRFKNLFSKKGSKDPMTPKEEPTAIPSDKLISDSSLDNQSIHSSEASQESQKSLFSRIKESFLKEYGNELTPPKEESLSGDSITSVSSALSSSNRSTTAMIDSDSLSSNTMDTTSLNETHSPSESILLNPYNPSSYVEASFAPSNDTPPSLLSRFKNLFSKKGSKDPMTPKEEPTAIPSDKLISDSSLDNQSIHSSEASQESQKSLFSRIKESFLKEYGNELTPPKEESLSGDSITSVSSALSSSNRSTTAMIDSDSLSSNTMDTASLNETHSPSESILLNPYNPSSYVEASFAPLNETHSPLDNPSSIHPNEALQNEASQKSKKSLLSKFKNFFSKKNNKDLMTPKEEPSLWITSDILSSLDNQSIHSSEASQESQSAKEAQTKSSNNNITANQEAKVDSKDENVPRKAPYKRKHLDMFLPAPLEVIREQIAQEHREEYKNNTGFDLGETSKETRMILDLLNQKRLLDNSGATLATKHSDLSEKSGGDNNLKASETTPQRVPYEVRKKKYLNMLITDDIKFAKEIVERNLEEFKNNAKRDLGETSRATQNQKRLLDDSGATLATKHSDLSEKSGGDNNLKASDTTPQKVTYKKKFIPGALEVIHEEPEVSDTSSLSDKHSSLDDSQSIHQDGDLEGSKNSLLSKIKNFFVKKNDKILQHPKKSLQRFSQAN